MCLWVLVVLVGVVLLVGVELVLELVVEDEELEPHTATAIVLARTAAVVSMAVSDVLLMGRAPIVARGFGRSPYQALTPPFAVARQEKRGPARRLPGGCAAL